jgi:hypothetical protein
MDFDFDGLDDLIRRIDEIEHLTPQLKNKALIRGGDILRDSMKEEVYANGLEKRSGDGQEALIRTDPKQQSLYVGIRGGEKAPGYYLYMHEVGFYNVRAKRFIAPRPFASIAFEKSKPDIFNAYVDEFRKGLGIK